MNQAVFFIKSTLCVISLFFQTAYAQNTSRIQGRVTDESGNPIVQATVVLLPDHQTTVTDKDGRFSFNKLYEGTYQLQVTCIGYDPTERDILVKKSDLHTIEQVLKRNETELSEVWIQERQGNVDNLINAENAAMPVKVITRREIELMGSRRLDEVMKEQTGIAVINDIAGGSRAVGVQIQGFSSNYVMVLVDGQPMLGRNNGNFDLSRISVTNIERIEIIKGASSCLYGSDALGGAINIITRHGAIAPQAHASFLYGSLNVVDATLEAETPFAHQRGSVTLSGNCYRTDGFNTNKEFLSNGTTTPPYDNYSVQGRTRYRISKEGTLGLSLRYAKRNSTMINEWSDELILHDKQGDQDLNLSASYDHHFHSGIRSMSRYYFTRYQTQMQAEWIRQSALASAEEFGQGVHRIEQQFAYSPFKALHFTGGIGGSLELMDNKDLSDERSLNTAFAYLQSEWQASTKIHTTTGIRYDYTNAYHGRLTPSLGIHYRIDDHLLIKMGAGAGFKAPDYKMRYQVFYNPAANYMVVGTDQVREILEAMEDNGELSYINTYMVNLTAGNLKAENSISLNAGVNWTPHKKLRTELSVFHHRLNNQINTISVGSGTGIGQIYTYRNLPKAVNKGLEASVAVQVSTDLELSAGYQYLIAKDLSVLDSIRAGRYPYNQMINNPVTGESKPVTTGSYWGIENRSRHMLNLKALYEYRPWDMNINLRANIRSKYPFQEINGNQFIDEYDAFVPDHVLLNLTVEKRLLNNRLSVRLVADNLLGFTHQYMPGQPGSVILGGISYRWFND